MNGPDPESIRKQIDQTAQELADLCVMYAREIASLHARIVELERFLRWIGEELPIYSESGRSEVMRRIEILVPKP